MQPSSFGFKNTALLTTLCLFLLAGFISVVQADGTITYEYDDLGRLESVEYDGGGDTTVSDYEYDEVGNRETKTVTIVEQVSDTAYSINNATDDEGEKIRFEVSRSGAAIGEEKIDYATSNGSASSSDYTSTSGTLTFGINDETKTFDVQTTEDSDVENDETFTVTLSNLVDGDTIADSTGTGTIDDDDAVSTSIYTINNRTMTEGNSATFTVTRSGTPLVTENISYATANGSALSTTDYFSKTGSLSFATNVNTRTFSVSTREDAVDENTETFYVNLSNQSAGTIGDSQGSGTISDDDGPSLLTNSSGTLYSSHAATYDSNYGCNVLPPVPPYFAGATICTLVVSLDATDTSVFVMVNGFVSIQAPGYTNSGMAVSVTAAKYGVEP